MLFFSNKSILKRVVSEADPHPAGTARAYRRYCPKKRTEWRPAGGGAPEPPAEPPALRCPACGGEVYQRDDDREETVKNRFRVYQEQTAPLIEYYTGSGKLAPIDGAKGQDEVFGEICALLG